MAKELLSYAEIGRQLNLTEARIRQLEKSALNRMRKHLQHRGVTLADIFLLQSYPEVSREILDQLPKYYDNTF